MPKDPPIPPHTICLYNWAEERRPLPCFVEVGGDEGDGEDVVVAGEDEVVGDYQVGHGPDADEEFALGDGGGGSASEEVRDRAADEDLVLGEGVGGVQADVSGEVEDVVVEAEEGEVEEEVEEAVGDAGTFPLRWPS